MTTARLVAAVRSAEAASGVGDPVLMGRAASALAAVVADVLRGRVDGSGAVSGRVYGSRVVLLVGGGSNGGDALLAGALLAGRGAAVTALLAAEHASERALGAFRSAGGRVVAAADASSALVAGALAGADAVVDGLLGAGGRPGLAPSAAALVAAVPPRAPVVAVDLPSGVDPDTGEVPPDGRHVVADATVAFGAAKPALLLPPAAPAAGRVVVAPIGLRLPAPQPGELVVERLGAAAAAALWPVPQGASDKYSRGVVGVVAGGEAYTGAAVLCVGAAVRAGAGMVRYLGPPRPTELVRQRWPEAVPGPGRVQAWVAGPGVDPQDGDQAPAVHRALDAAVEEGLPCLLDAGALPALLERVLDDGPLRAPLLLTPHAGELARLLSALDAEDGGTGPVTREEVAARPLRCARAAAEATGATVLLKGAATLVVAPGGRVRSQADAPAWLASAGAGDVLAGVAGALLAAGLAPLDAGALAAAVHGRAALAASGGGPLHAEVVAAALPGVVAHLLTTGTWP
ncbi:bifunctional ADP-dependent NAD(P)H-hydrate dehydratase/NAD(P)H-hydrate epimerase [Quadrisphaera sp. DSM 44207]|uniref:bifunctional ADP-dependent NAD(P)H-hydrate dehydratase/NAD(P)H-hydrate epimerase n=1 Tax=Quadrisphaera sp. DSM 44207 TaxID=1881057 RepID=UPI0008846971|nr:bifunctional ADP-dependent NAD(P)H-hydrate dehydratase/NAD(P)H-hydrate epimerase [Quadrisphaera sp. DSM 44207]SDQ13641.1 yjeF C-terminal region, hydroxyethylthiazole kinase-related/yjeF N-terminal region [Quadrisphaera sp. DSM 44207]